jgi:hypothetical protein
MFIKRITDSQQPPKIEINSSLCASIEHAAPIQGRNTEQAITAS